MFAPQKPQKVVCEMIGGPLEGRHEGEIGINYGDQVRGWALVTDNFQVGRGFQAVAPLPIPAAGESESPPAPIEPLPPHRYEIVSREERDGVWYVCCECRGPR